MLALGHFAHRP